MADRSSAALRASPGRRSRKDASPLDHLLDARCGGRRAWGVLGTKRRPARVAHLGWPLWRTQLPRNRQSELAAAVGSPLSVGLGRSHECLDERISSTDFNCCIITMFMPTVSSPSRADRDARCGSVVLATCCLSVFMAGLDVTIVNVALPSIQHALQASVSGLQWTIDAYTLVIACLLMLSGSLADRFGRRRVFQIGQGVF